MPRFSALRAALTDASGSLPPPLRWALLAGGGLVLLCGLVMLMPAATPEPAAGPATTGPALLSVGNVLAALLLAGGAAFALYLRRRPPEAGRDAAAPLRALGTLSLAQGQQLRLVACADEVLLLAVTADAVTLLRSYDRAAFDAATTDAAALREAAAGDGAAAETPAPSLADLIRHHASFSSHA